MAPSGYTAQGYDINPSGPYNKVPATSAHFNIMTMWDVIEHLPAPFAPILTYSPEYVVISTPNADVTAMETFTEWKHYKPLEHLHYYTPKTLSMSLRGIGYRLLFIDFSEGRLRDAQNPEAIFTAVFKCSSNS